MRRGGGRRGGGRRGGGRRDRGGKKGERIILRARSVRRSRREEGDEGAGGGGKGLEGERPTPCPPPHIVLLFHLYGDPIIKMLCKRQNVNILTILEGHRRRFLTTLADPRLP